MECSKMESKEDSKESNVSFKRKTHCPLFRVCPIKSLFSGISCASAERDDSQGCAAHVKETPPSPKEKPEDLIGADIDSVRDDEDWFESLYSLIAKGSMELNHSGGSLKSNQSKAELTDFNTDSPLSSPDFSSSEEEHVVADDEDWVKSSDALEDSKESGVSFKSDRSQCYKIWSLFRPEDLIGADIDSVRDDEDWAKSSYSLMAKGSMESDDSGVSFKSDRSKGRLIYFKDRVSLSRSDLSFLMMDNDVADDEDWVESSYSLMAQRRPRSDPITSNVLIPLSQQSPLMMAKGSMESIDSGVSFKSDGSKGRLTDFKDRVFLNSAQQQRPDSAVTMGRSKMESKEDSKESDVSFKTDLSQLYKILSSLRVRLESLRSAISRASAKWDDLQGRTAHVKETPPSPKEKPEDLIGADIDSVRDDKGLVKSSDDLMPRRSVESTDSAVSFKSDRSKDELIYFKDRVSFLEEMNQELSSEVGWEHL